MAHTHFNGACEQSARNYKGAVTKNFGSGRLDARLSCKTATPYIGIVSGCLIPLAVDEDTEIELERSVKMRGGYRYAADVRSYARESCVYAESRKTIGVLYTSLRPQLSEKERAEFYQAVDMWDKKPRDTKALDILNSYIEKHAHLINKRWYQQYKNGKLDPVFLLCKAGLIVYTDSYKKYLALQCKQNIRKLAAKNKELQYAIRVWEQERGNKKARSVLNAFIDKYKHLIGKNAMETHKSGNADPVLLLCNAGLIDPTESYRKRVAEVAAKRAAKK